MKHHLYLINGPPRSGKDTVASMLTGDLFRGRHLKLAAELKERTHAAYRLFRHDGQPFDHDAYEETKDQRREVAFLGLTPREAYIAFHERYLKPVHGPDILGRLLIEREQRLCGRHKLLPWAPDASACAVSDAGDAAQCVPLIEAWGRENVTLIHLTRPGCEWTDNRVRFELLDVETVELNNNGSSWLSLRDEIQNVIPETRD